MYVGAGRAAGADRDATARELAQVTQSVFGVRFDGEQTVGKALQHATGFGQAHATRQSLEQADADTALEFGELLGNRGLADVQAACAAADAVDGGDRLKDGAMIEIHEREDRKSTRLNSSH